MFIPLPSILSYIYISESILDRQREYWAGLLFWALEAGLDPPLLQPLLVACLQVPRLHHGC